MASAYIFVIACGLLALAYGLLTSRSVLAADAGNARMQEISGAVQLGASAYLNRQYRTIAIVGVVILIILLVTLGWRVAVGYFIGSVLSGVGWGMVQIAIMPFVAIAAGVVLWFRHRAPAAEPRYAG